MRQGFVFSIIVLVVFCAPVFGVGGDMGVSTEPLTDGSETYPWLIEDLDDFDEFAGNSAYWASGVHTKLMTDIDLSGRTYETAAIAPDTDTSFMGLFDGKSHIIRNLTIDGVDYCGLFGMLTTGSEVENLELEDVSITGTYRYIGGLVGYNSSGTITNCSSTGVITGSNYSVGGMVGYNLSGSITGCYSAATINGTSYTGGLIGYNDNGSIISSYSTGIINGSNFVGGLVGGNDYGSITSCHSTGNVTAWGYSIGGLAGRNDHGMITDSYSTGDVSDGRSLGGLVGDNSGSITNCYATGVTLGEDKVGGLVGYNYDGGIITVS